MQAAPAPQYCSLSQQPASPHPSANAAKITLNIAQSTRILTPLYDAAPGSKVWTHVRDLCRAGIPRELRSKWWMAMSGAQAKRESSAFSYSDLQRAGAAGDSREACVAVDIEKDLKRTFPEHALFTSTEGQNSLRRVLTAYAARNPSVGCVLRIARVFLRSPGGSCECV